jgi:hypothetical protein
MQSTAAGKTVVFQFYWKQEQRQMGGTTCSIY